MKAPRFMIEYANCQIKSFSDPKCNKQVNNGIKLEMIRRIDRAVRYFESGMITLDEAMYLLTLKAYENEDMSQYMI